MTFLIISILLISIPLAFFLWSFFFGFGEEAIDYLLADERSGLFYALSALLMIISIESCILERRTLNWDDLGWRTANWRWVFGAVASALIIVVIEPLVGIHVLSEMDLSALEEFNLESFPLQPDVPLLLSLIVGIGPATAIAEECLFRGVLNKAARARMNFLPAAVISSVIFAAVHVHYFTISVTVSVYVGCALFLSGMVFVWLYEKSASLTPPIICHALMNTGFMLALYDSPLSFNAFF